MKQKTLLLIIFLAVSGCLQAEEKSILSVNVPPEYKAMKNPIPASENSINEGKRLYSIYCETCHPTTERGNELKVRGEKPFNLLKNAPKLTDGELYYIINRGVKINNKTVMLPYGDLLSEEEHWHLVNYIRTLPIK
jgi:mono/diheme cytochrome c family protein